MQKTINLDREFVRWFYEDEYPQLGYNRSGIMSNINSLDPLERDYWMRIAFKQGAKSMVNYITTPENNAACAELTALDEAFDRAAFIPVCSNQQLELFK